MKRFLALSLSFVMLFGLCGCGEKSVSDASKTDKVKMSSEEFRSKVDDIEFLIKDFVPTIKAYAESGLDQDFDDRLDITYSIPKDIADMESKIEELRKSGSDEDIAYLDEMILRNDEIRDSAFDMSLISEDFHKRMDDISELSDRYCDSLYRYKTSTYKTADSEMFSKIRSRYYSAESDYEYHSSEEGLTPEEAYLYSITFIRMEADIEKTNVKIKETVREGFEEKLDAITSDIRSITNDEDKSRSGELNNLVSEFQSLLTDDLTVIEYESYSTHSWYIEGALEDVWEDFKGFDGSAFKAFNDAIDAINGLLT